MYKYLKLYGWSIITLVLAILLICFNYLIYINSPTTPHFDRYQTFALRQQAFMNYLAPNIAAANQDVLSYRNKIISLHKKFLTTHQLTQNDLYQLNRLYMRIVNFQPYQTRDWAELLAHVDIVPLSIILNHFHGWQPNHNPFQMRYLQPVCYLSKTLLDETYPWMTNPDCYFISRVMFTMLNNPDNLPQMQYHSLNEAIADYVWTINTNPAFAQFRQLRSQRRQENLSVLNWQENSLSALTDLTRLNSAQYYQPSS